MVKKKKLAEGNKTLRPPHVQTYGSNNLFDFQHPNAAHICHGIFTIVECLPVAENLNVNCAQVVSSSSPSYAFLYTCRMHVKCTHAPIDTQQNISSMLAQYYAAASDRPQSNSTKRLFPL